MKVLDALFIQPTFACALDCRGCYVKESTKGSQLSKSELAKFVYSLWTDKRVLVSAITIAVDNIPKFDQVSKDIMVNTLGIALKRASDNPGQIELNVTMNSPDTLHQYADAGISPLTIFKNCDLVSFSHIKGTDITQLKELRAEGKAKLNYNYTHSNQEKIIRYLHTLQHVDMSYYVLHKAGLGKTNDPEAIKVFKEGLLAMKDWPQDIKNKVVVDRCVQDAFSYVKTGFGCNANVSRMQVWPDGHVTGCPYNKDGGKPASTMNDIYNNIIEVGKEYEFNRCTIPTGYRGQQQEVKPKSLPIIT